MKCVSQSRALNAVRGDTIRRRPTPRVLLPRPAARASRVRKGESRVDAATRLNAPAVLLVGRARTDLRRLAHVGCSSAQDVEEGMPAAAR